VVWIARAIGFIVGATLSLLIPLALARLGVVLSHNQVVGFIIFTVTTIALLLGLYKAGKIIVARYLDRMRSIRVEDRSRI